MEFAPTARGGDEVTSDPQFFADVGTLAAVIARSQIVIAFAHSPVRLLPPGFDDADVAVLEWIAAEGRRARAIFARQ
jgi:hypothetical protein